MISNVNLHPTTVRWGHHYLANQSDKVAYRGKAIAFNILREDSPFALWRHSSLTSCWNQLTSLSSLKSVPIHQQKGAAGLGAATISWSLSSHQQVPCADSLNRWDNLNTVYHWVMFRSTKSQGDVVRQRLFCPEFISKGRIARHINVINIL